MSETISAAWTTATAAMVDSVRMRAAGAAADAVPAKTLNGAPMSTRPCAGFSPGETEWLPLHERKINREIQSVATKPISNSISKSSEEHERLLAAYETGVPNEKINGRCEPCNGQAALRS